MKLTVKDTHYSYKIQININRFNMKLVLENDLYRNFTFIISKKYIFHCKHYHSPLHIIKFIK